MEEVIDRLWKSNDFRKMQRDNRKNAGTRRKGDRFRGHAWNRPNFNAGSRSWNIRFDRFTALAAIVRFIARGNGIVRGRFTRPPIDCLTPIFFPPPLFFFCFFHLGTRFFPRELTARGVSRRWMAHCEAMSGIVIRREGWEYDTVFGDFFFFRDVRIMEYFSTKRKVCFFWMERLDEYFWYISGILSNIFNVEIFQLIRKKEEKQFSIIFLRKLIYCYSKYFIL